MLEAFVDEERQFCTCSIYRSRASTADYAQETCQLCRCSRPDSTADDNRSISVDKVLLDLLLLTYHIDPTTHFDCALRLALQTVNISAIRRC